MFHFLFARITFQVSFFLSNRSSSNKNTTVFSMQQRIQHVPLALKISTKLTALPECKGFFLFFFFNLLQLIFSKKLSIWKKGSMKTLNYYKPSLPPFLVNCIDSYSTTVYRSVQWIIQVFIYSVSVQGKPSSVRHLH